jgi:hypothetical protein
MPFALVSATGGKIVVTSASNAELAVGSYTLTKNNKQADTTHSGTGGWETHTKVVKGAKIQAKVFWDTTSGKDPDTLALDDAWTANLWIGNTGKMYAAVSILTESLAITACSQDGVVEFDVQGNVNGALPSQTTAA